MVEIKYTDTKGIKCNECNHVIKRNEISISIPKAFKNIHQQKYNDLSECYTKEGKNVHLHCWKYFWMRPYQCMFGDSLNNLSRKDADIVEVLVRRWQKDYRENVKNYEKHKEKIGKRKRKSVKLKANKKRKMDSSMVIDEEVFFMGLTKEIWGTIFTYLPLEDIGCVALSCRDLNTYTNSNTVWEMLAKSNLSESIATIKIEMFPHIENYKDFYKEVHKHICKKCGDYCESCEANYFYFIDGTLCASCRASEEFELLNKSNAKKIYKLNDNELNVIRSARSSNPFHRSTAMFKYLRMELETLSLYKNSQTQKRIQRRHAVKTEVATD